MGRIGRGGALVSFLSLKHLQPKLFRQTKAGEGNQAPRLTSLMPPEVTRAVPALGSSMAGGQNRGAHGWLLSSGIQHSCYPGGNVEPFQLNIF